MNQHWQVSDHRSFFPDCRVHYFVAFLQFVLIWIHYFLVNSDAAICNCFVVVGCGICFELGAEYLKQRLSKPSSFGVCGKFVFVLFDEPETILSFVQRAVFFKVTFQNLLFLLLFCLCIDVLNFNINSLGTISSLPLAEDTLGGHAGFINYN